IEGNRLFLVKPREFHSILPDAVRRPISYYAVLFEPDQELTADREVLSLINDRNSGEPLPAARFLTVESRERFLVEELYRLGGDKAHTRAGEYLLLSLLYRWYGEPVSGGIEFREDHIEKNEHIERALVLMGKLVQEKLSIDSLAGRIGLSPEHFIRLFHRKLGISPFQYFTRLKIEAASSFLVDTNLKIGAVADHFGFENPFHFSRIFKKCTGLSPLEYRRTFSRTQPLP
ncbi:MAG: AraC family transcriptional regulator, partial [Treponema sp.]|nr:AraC family transcriptional regulator [Treponema sp.]